MNKQIRRMIALCAMLSGCATTPRPVVEGPISPLTPQAARADQGVGPNERVRWGGEILNVETAENRTCFEILAQELDSSGRPSGDGSDYAGESRPTGSRFLACDQGFYDPAIYAKRRDLTVVGTLVDSETRKIGEHDYRYPLLQVEKLHLWPKYSAYRDPYFYDPFWGWPYSRFGYGFGLGYHPFYFRGRHRHW
ncbi:MAG: Slp family lipoprotein [Burkholderiales bacterium]